MQSFFDVFATCFATGAQLAVLKKPMYFGHKFVRILAVKYEGGGGVQDFEEEDSSKMGGRVSRREQFIGTNFIALKTVSGGYDEKIK